MIFAEDRETGRQGDGESVTITSSHHHTITPQHPNTLTYAELNARANQLVGYFKYNTDLFDEATIARMASHFTMLLEGIVNENPLGAKQLVHQLPMLTEAEYHQIVYEWNDTSIDFGEPQTIHALFEQQVVRTPDAIDDFC